MEELERSGTEQNRIVYAKHGIRMPMFGVSFANLKRIAREYRNCSRQAMLLWNTENHDARMLATMIADPAVLGQDELCLWAEEADNYVLCGNVAMLTVRYPNHWMIAQGWIEHPSEWMSTIGWNTISILAAKQMKRPDSDFRPLIDFIVKNIHKAPNRTKYAMNSALIAIGRSRKSLTPVAIKAGEVIGEISVNHGESGNNTPFAPNAIKEAVAVAAE